MSSDKFMINIVNEIAFEYGVNIAEDKMLYREY